MQEAQAQQSPCRRGRPPPAAFLPGESHGQRSLVGCSPWGHKESDTIEGLTHSLTRNYIYYLVITFSEIYSANILNHYAVYLKQTISFKITTDSSHVPLQISPDLMPVSPTTSPSASPTLPFNLLPFQSLLLCNPNSLPHTMNTLNPL